MCSEVIICGIRMVVFRFWLMCMVISIYGVVVRLYSVDVSVNNVMFVRNMCLCLNRLFRCVLLRRNIVYVVL